MKRRVRKIANFFAFNLLFFALYLNFVHKDRAAAVISTEHKVAATTSISGTVLVDHPEQYIQKPASSTNMASPGSVAGN